MRRGPKRKPYSEDHGYKLIYLPNHPNCTQDGYMREHRVIMEKYIGRYLENHEVVHHINGNKKDNKIENLELMTVWQHGAHHNKSKLSDKDIDDIRYRYKNGSSGIKLAKEYKVNDSTIYRIVNFKRHQLIERPHGRQGEGI